VSGTQIILAILGVLAAVAGTNFLTSVLTRRSIVRQMEAGADKTLSEGRKADSEGRKADSERRRTDAETADVLWGQIQKLSKEVVEKLDATLDCKEQLAATRIKLVESDAETSRLKAAVKEVRDENVLKDERISYLHGILNDAEVKY
jgi:hypothetical protein